jgi:hypothetical protein
VDRRARAGRDVVYEDGPGNRDRERAVGRERERMNLGVAVVWEGGQLGSKVDLQRAG